MTLNEAAIHAKRSPRQLRKWIDAGMLPAMRLSKHAYYINIVDLERWVRPPRNVTHPH